MTFKCPYCDKTSNTLKGLAIHCRRSHQIARENLYEKLNGPQRKICGCGEPLPFKGMEIGWRDLCGKCQFKKSWSENDAVPWNKGLTKETSASLQKTSRALKAHYQEHDHWALGKTKENSEVIRQKSETVSKRLKAFYAENEHWSLGLTAETSDAIRRRSVASGDTQRGRALTDEHRQALSNAKILQGYEVDERLASFGFERLSEYSGNQEFLTVRCTTCGEQAQKTLHAIMYGSKCHTCYPPWQASASKWQLEVNGFVASLGFDTKVDDRAMLDGKEIDVYIPSENFGIECDGLYWHSMASGRCTPSQQEDKRLLAQSKGIDLWFFFHDEWEQKQEIVKSMISHRLKAKHIQKVHGRKCQIELCEPVDLRPFINATHIEGYVPAHFGLKLTFNDEIVGGCTLRWKRGSKRTILEIARMSFALNTHINGGVSRFIKQARHIASEHDAMSLISYADNRLGGRCYSQFMTLNKMTAPRFWWTDFSTRYNRFKYRADQSRGMSEREVAEEAKVSKIYGSSNSLFSIRLR